jgi:hypothetical protein
VEVVRNVARVWLYLDQRMIRQDREVRQPGEGLSADQAAQEGRWQWFQIGPGELQGEYEVIPEGGSMAAPNMQQNIQLAQMMLGPISQSQYVDPAKPLEHALTLLGVKDPQSWLKQRTRRSRRRRWTFCRQMGVKPDLIQYAVAEAQRRIRCSTRSSRGRRWLTWSR